MQPTSRFCKQGPNKTCGFVRLLFARVSRFLIAVDLQAQPKQKRLAFVKPALAQLRLQTFGLHAVAVHADFALAQLCLQIQDVATQHLEFAKQTQDVATQHLEFAKQTQGVATQHRSCKSTICNATLTKASLFLQIYDLQPFDLRTNPTGL